MIETLSLNQTAEYLRGHGFKIGNVVLANGLEQGKFEFGFCIVNDQGRRSFQIFRALLDKWIAERAVCA